MLAAMAREGYEEVITVSEAGDAVLKAFAAALRGILFCYSGLQLDMFENFENVK